jgi:hypothetical protein
MMRFVIVCSITLLALAGIAHAQEESAPPAEAPAAPPPTSIADLVWQPSTGQLSAWISEGITAAGSDMNFFEMPVVDRMTWSSLDGVPLVSDRALRFGALMTPELTSYVVGYGAAWDEDTWNAIQEDVDEVSNDLATSLRGNVPGGPMYFAIAVNGPAYDDMMAAVYYEGQWRTLDVKPWGTVADYTPDNVGRAMADPLWAAKYLLSQDSSEPALQPADQSRVYLCTWVRNASTQIDADFLGQLPQPDWTDLKRARLVVGNADLLAWVDFDMGL